MDIQQNNGKQGVRTRHIDIRLTENEYEMIVEKAAECGLTLSNYGRKLLQNHLLSCSVWKRAACLRGIYGWAGFPTCSGGGFCIGFFIKWSCVTVFNRNRPFLLA